MICANIFRPAILAASLLLVRVAAAQSVTATSTTDINGHVVTGPEIVSNAERTELTRSINGREVPLEQTEEKVLREDATGKVTEKITRKFDSSGQLMSTERVVTDTEKLPDGGSKVDSTSYHSDINGQMQPFQRTSTESHRQGGTTYAETVVDRPTLNDAFQTIEKRNIVTETTGGTTTEREDVFRRSGNGDFYEAVRQVREEQKSDSETLDHTDYYEPDATGTLKLARQNVARTVKSPDGSEVTEVNLYANSVPGTVQYPGASQKIQEQQIIRREKTSGGAVETLTVRRPTISDPGQLGAPQKISETVCKGKCDAGGQP